ncbi:HAD family phosphatase [Stieleria sp. TO1_6]|uniref:HAD family hydrolase n=1 Tax=Stieleria tagensis TaxID=2956795 RepID=UPI00209AAEAF|nr:HAD family phosphatase [Stieleria tagensis]MCO8123885.1 HAD family phosphatase [Stieleria tagensis]
MAIEFVYFDLGNVLVRFDPQIACRNVAKLTGVSVDAARQLIYDSGLQERYEQGEITGHGFAMLVREQLKVADGDLSKEDLLTAISDMFSPIDSMVDVVNLARRRAGRIGVLSNTCQAHWNWIRRQPWAISQIDYDVQILSCEVKSMKPGPGIYAAAEKAAQVGPDQILFIDDKPENVAAASQRGWNAHQCVGGDDAKAVIQQYFGE